MDEPSQKYLIRLTDCIEQQKYSLIKDKLSKYAKYFFDIRSKTVLIYDNTLIYIISREETRVTDLGKQHAIVQLIYNPFKNILVFITHDGSVIAHFVTQKTQLPIRKDVKKQAIFGWIYGKQHIDLFIADCGGVRLYKIEQEKKAIKQVKSISNKYNSFLYEPLSQTLVCFPVGDCKTVTTFLFDDQTRAKNYYKGPEVPLNIECDEQFKAVIKKNKSLGLKSSNINCQIFQNQQAEEFSAELIKITNKIYIIFYFASEGKLKLNLISQQIEQQITIKLPSDCLPSFTVVDHMLVIQMKNQKITFIYDISHGNAQMLVSPFPLQHTRQASINPYNGVFIGNRHFMPNGDVSKWVVNIPVIFHYLKNELLIFDFLMRRDRAKADLIKWLRENLLKIKQINLSKFWKLIFIKMKSVSQKERDAITLPQLYANVFYTLSVDELTSKQPLINVILECIRQAKCKIYFKLEMKISIPLEMQKLTFELLLECKKYQTLVFLSHTDIIKDRIQYIDTLLKRANKENEQILFTLSIDMANRVCSPQKVFQMLILNQRVWQARRYMRQNYQKIDVIFMIYVSKEIEDEETRKQFLKLTRAFILKKFSHVSEKYLDEAEQKVYCDKKVPTKEEVVTVS